MVDLNYSKLQPFSANNTENKRNYAKENDVCKNEVEKYLTNLCEHILSLKVYDACSLLIAEQDWLKRKDKSGNSDYIIGRLIKVDFGKVYETECGYIHYAICVSEYSDKILVIPTTTSTDEIKSAYHPQFRPYGKRRLLLFKKDDKNPKDCALYMNDARFISKGRILNVGNKINDSSYNEIVKLLFEISFPSLTRYIDKLEEEKTGLLDQIKLLKEIIANTNKKEIKT